ncbi:MAG: HAD-IIIA family hydrolase [Magnetococcus sp. MYC-9]
MTRQAVILAGGQGTRLGALTRQLPKPLLPVGGSPFLDYLVWNLSRQGVDDILISCGHLGEQIAAHFSDWRHDRTRIRTFIEPEPLGTGGALRFLRGELQDHFLLLNGDSLFDINYLDLAIDAPILSAVMGVRLVDNAARYGRVELQEGRVVRFLEKDPAPQPGLINAGVCWMDSHLLERLPEGVSALEKALFPHLAAEGGLFGKRYEGYFIDMGIPEDLQRAEQELPVWRRKPAIFFDRDGVINQDHGYVCSPERFAWVTGAPQAIRWCNDHGYLVIVVTNQSGIARGYYDTAQFQSLTAWIQSELAAFGAHIDATYHCPHHPDAGEAGAACRCRKPNPGMLEQAMAEWQIDGSRSLLIGDNLTDVEAARRAGIPGFLFPGEGLDHFLLGCFDTLHSRAENPGESV